MANNSPNSPRRKTRGKPPPHWKERFLESLRRNRVIYVACDAAQVDRKTARTYKAKDPEFSQAWDDALEDATDVLEYATRARALKGVSKPVYSKRVTDKKTGAYEMVKVGEITEYHDVLAMFMLKGERPEKYRESPNFEKFLARYAQPQSDESEPEPDVPKRARKSRKADDG